MRNLWHHSLLFLYTPALQLRILELLHCVCPHSFTFAVIVLTSPLKILRSNWKIPSHMGHFLLRYWSGIINLLRFHLPSFWVLTLMGIFTGWSLVIHVCSWLVSGTELNGTALKDLISSVCNIITALLGRSHWVECSVRDTTHLNLNNVKSGSGFLKA